MNFTSMSNDELILVNGGGAIAAGAVIILGVVATVACLATFPPAAPLVGKVIFTVGAAITTGAGAYAAGKI